MFDFDSVSRLNGYIKQSLADNPYLADFSVVGEISQYTVLISMRRAENSR